MHVSLDPLLTALLPFYDQALAKMNALRSLLFLSTFISASISVTITDIQGPAFQSPYAGKAVTNVTALVTAKVRTYHVLE
jgi:hypothetical protein